jgi:hypothetical protein
MVFGLAGHVHDINAFLADSGTKRRVYQCCARDGSTNLMAEVAGSNVMIRTFVTGCATAVTTPLRTFGQLEDRLWLDADAHSRHQ